MTNLSWLGELEMLLGRFSYLGIGADVASLSITELWGVRIHLLRLVEACDG